MLTGLTSAARFNGMCSEIVCVPARMWSERVCAFSIPDFCRAVIREIDCDAVEDAAHDTVHCTISGDGQRLEPTLTDGSGEFQLASEHRSVHTESETGRSVVLRSRHGKIVQGGIRAGTAAWRWKSQGWSADRY